MPAGCIDCHYANVRYTEGSCRSAVEVVSRLMPTTSSPKQCSAHTRIVDCDIRLMHQWTNGDA